MTLSRGVCVKIGEFDNEMYINAPYGGDVKPVRCNGAWKKFYRRIGRQVTLLDSTRLAGEEEYYRKRILSEIKEQLFSEIEDDIVTRQENDPMRMRTTWEYEFTYCFIKPRALQALIQAALGDGKAREFVIRMLVEMEE